MTDYEKMADGDPIHVFHARNNRTFILTNIDYTEGVFIFEIFDAQGRRQKTARIPFGDFQKQYEAVPELVRVA